MSELIAKNIVKDQFWIVVEQGKKVGNIAADQTGYGVQINGTTLHFESTNDLQKKMQIKFENGSLISTKADLPYPEFPTPKKVYNSLFDIQKGLHLFTKTKKSKCQHAAGWFVIDQLNNEQIFYCPKYIFVQRYPYKGPFKSKKEAEDALINIHDDTY